MSDTYAAVPGCESHGKVLEREVWCLFYPVLVAVGMINTTWVRKKTINW